MSRNRSSYLLAIVLALLIVLCVLVLRRALHDSKAGLGASPAPEEPAKDDH